MKYRGWNYNTCVRCIYACMTQTIESPLWINMKWITTSIIINITQSSLTDTHTNAYNETIARVYHNEQLIHYFYPHCGFKGVFYKVGWYDVRYPFIILCICQCVVVFFFMKMRESC